MYCMSKNTRALATKKKKKTNRKNKTEKEKERKRKWEKKGKREKKEKRFNQYMTTRITQEPKRTIPPCESVCFCKIHLPHTHKHTTNTTHYTPAPTPTLTPAPTTTTTPALLSVCMSCLSDVRLSVSLRCLSVSLSASCLSTVSCLLSALFSLLSLAFHLASHPLFHLASHLTLCSDARSPLVQLCEMPREERGQVRPDQEYWLQGGLLKQVCVWSALAWRRAWESNRRALAGQRPAPTKTLQHPCPSPSERRPSIGQPAKIASVALLYVTNWLGVHLPPPNPWGSAPPQHWRFLGEVLLPPQQGCLVAVVPLRAVRESRCACVLHRYFTFCDVHLAQQRDLQATK